MPIPTQNRGLQFAPTSELETPNITPALAALEARVKEGALRPDQIQRLNSLFTKKGRLEEQNAVKEQQLKGLAFDKGIAAGGPIVPPTPFALKVQEELAGFVDPEELYDADGQMKSDAELMRLRKKFADVIKDPAKRMEVDEKLNDNIARQNRLAEVARLIESDPSVVGTTGGSAPAQIWNKLKNAVGVDVSKEQYQDNIKQAILGEVSKVIQDGSKSGAISPRALGVMQGAVPTLDSDYPVWQAYLKRVQEALKQDQAAYERSLGRVDKTTPDAQTTPGPSVGSGKTSADPVRLPQKGSELVKAIKSLPPGTWYLTPQGFLKQTPL